MTELLQTPVVKEMVAAITDALLEHRTLSGDKAMEILHTIRDRELGDDASEG